jgi:hypothetical protein
MTHDHIGHQRSVENMTAALVILECLPWGRGQGKAQSERAKRGPRQSGDAAVSSARRTGARHATGTAQSGGPAPASKTVQGMGTNLGFGWGWSSYALTTALTSQQDRET